MKSWVIQMFTSSLGRKYVMSLTGLFLCSFLVVHLTANLISLIPDGGLSFNAFASFLEHNILIRSIEYLLFAGFIIHILQSITLTIKNNRARPQKYEVKPGNSNSTWASRNMGILGAIIFIFLVIHLRDMFWDLRFHEEELGIDANGNVNLFKEMVAVFGMLSYTVLYVIAIIALGYHLWHGFPSAFRSLGLMHSKYTPAIAFIGKVYTIIITGGFLLIAVYWYIKQL
ncbi:MAG TPA: succinate dehydrogenase cytochrome b subunit [Chitinophagales bacterium]|nr:succinate dehydrogenase cytochrome b subunit [Chitinophagales bacterium]